MVRAGATLGAAAAAAAVAAAEAKVYFKETFSDAAWRDRWVDSTWKGAEAMGEWEWSAGEWFADEEVNKGMMTKDKARFYAISSKLDEPFTNKDKDLVVQFSVKNEKRQNSFCGGGYIKLLPSNTDQESFGGDSPYHIMFGPDLCGYDVSRVHLIFNYNGENLLKNEDIKLEYNDKNEFTHLYTLHVRPDNSYTVYLDQVEKSTGTLPEGWAFPSKEIDDPEDKKPADWVDEKMMVDPEDKKPEGWDDIPAQIVDPAASKPEDWDDEDDGEWEAPMIDNPEFKGEWKPKMIENPDYKGEWTAKQIANPDYDPNVYAYDDIGMVGFELWVVDNGSVFDNIFIGDDLEEAKAFAEETFTPYVQKEKDVKTALDEEKKAAEKKAADAAAADAEEDDLDADEKEEL